MNTVFDFLNYVALYEKCVLASVVFAIMVGEYDLLSAEQSWDGLNYNFQNAERTVIIMIIMRNKQREKI